MHEKKYISNLFVTFFISKWYKQFNLSLNIDNYLIYFDLLAFYVNYLNVNKLILKLDLYLINLIIK